MRSQVEVEGIIAKLETLHGIVASFDGLVQLFYKVTQDWDEKIPACTTRIEETLNKIRLKSPDRLDTAVVEGH